MRTSGAADAGRPRRGSVVRAGLGWRARMSRRAERRAWPSRAAGLS
ncbi:hypothetical protein ACFPN7_23320 [Amycolatopsis halotolerans]